MDAVEPLYDKKELKALVPNLAAKLTMNKSAWFIVSVIAIVAVLFAGLLPLPGQKDNVTPHSQPAPTAAVPPPPVGPAEIPATGADALKQSPTK